MIRKRVLAGTLALFVATWLLITVILVSGHDPALAHSKSATTSSSGTGNSDGSTSSGNPSVVTPSSSAAGGSGLSSVTSSQS